MGGLTNLIIDVVNRCFPRLIVRGPWEFRVKRTTDGRCDLEPSDQSIGWSPIPLVDVWPGVPGCKVDLPDGFPVLVDYINGDESKPYIASFVPFSVALPTTIKIDAGTMIELGEAASSVHREGDFGNAGKWTASGNVVTYTDANGNVQGALTFTSPDTTITIASFPLTGILTTSKAGPGAARVKA